MKRIITTIYAFIFITFLASCAQNGEPITPKSDMKKAVTLSIIDRDGNPMDRAPYPLDTKIIPYRIFNNTETTCQIVLIPKLEKNLGLQFEDKWEQIEFRDNVGFCGTPDTIDAGEIYDGEIDLSIFGDLTVGLYRLAFERFDNTDLIFADFLLQNEKEEVGEVEDVISRYYQTNAPLNTGELKVLDICRYEDQTFVLSEKYFGEGHRIIDLFALDKDLNITHKTDGQTAISPCYIVNSAVLGNKRIIFGDYNDQKWIPTTDQVIHVNLQGIQLRFDDQTEIEYDFNVKNVYLIIADTTASISEANVYDYDKNVVSTLSDTSNNEVRFTDMMQK